MMRSGGQPRLFKTAHLENCHLRVTVTIGKHGSQGGFLNSSITREFNAASSSANVKARSPTEAVDVL